MSDEKWMSGDGEYEVEVDNVEIRESPRGRMLLMHFTIEKSSNEEHPRGARRVWLTRLPEPVRFNAGSGQFEGGRSLAMMLDGKDCQALDAVIEKRTNRLKLKTRQRVARLDRSFTQCRWRMYEPRSVSREEVSQ